MLVNPWSGHDTIALTETAATAWSRQPNSIVQAIPWGWTGTDLHATLQQAVITGTYAEPVALSIEDLDVDDLISNAQVAGTVATVSPAVGQPSVRVSVTYASGGVDVMIPAGHLLTTTTSEAADTTASVIDTIALGAAMMHVANTFGTRLRRLVVALPEGADEPTGDVDAGAGLLAALGVLPNDSAAPAAGEETTTTTSWAAQHGCQLVVTTSSDEPFFLPGIRPGRRLDEPVLQDAERNHKRRLQLAEQVGAACGDRWMQQAVGSPGAGACGGLAWALFIAGGHRHLGPELLASLMGLTERVAQADVVVVMPEVFGWRQLRSSAVTVAAELAASQGVPCIVIAGASEVGRRELGAVGVHAAYSCVADPTTDAGQLPQPVPSETVANQVSRVAQTWARQG